MEAVTGMRKLIRQDDRQDNLQDDATERQKAARLQAILDNLERQHRQMEITLAMLRAELKR